MTNRKWPFTLYDCGTVIHGDRYYGFPDSGGVYGKVEGYTNYRDALTGISFVAKSFGIEVEDMVDYISSKPDELGSVGVCILTGIQFVDKLDEIEPNGSAIYGTWAE